MRLNNIDDIIKMGFQESERQNDFLVNSSKARVWNAIKKDKKQKFLYWGFVTAIAASVSLFLIAVFLVYKLDSKQKELDAVHAQIAWGISPTESPGENPFTDEIATTGLDTKSKELPEPLPQDKKAQIPPLVQEPKLAALAKEKDHNSEAAPLPMVEKKPINFKLNIKFPEYDPPELKEELVLSGTSGYKIPSSTKSKKQGKLKIRIGNGSPAHSPHHSLSLNLKL